MSCDKSHLIMSCKEATSAMVDDLSCESSKKGVLLGLTIDHELRFDKHVNYSCKKADQKLNVLVRVTTFMDVNKKRSLLKAFLSRNLDTVL